MTWSINQVNSRSQVRRATRASASRVPWPTSWWAAGTGWEPI